LSNAAIHTAAAQLTHEFHRTAKLRHTVKLRSTEIMNSCLQ